jgi:hypothetical protein
MITFLLAKVRNLVRTFVKEYITKKAVPFHHVYKNGSLSRAKRQKVAFPLSTGAYKHPAI